MVTSVSCMRAVSVTSRTRSWASSPLATGRRERPRRGGRGRAGGRRRSPTARGVPRALPRRRLGAGLMQDQPSHLDDQTGLLEERHELVGRQHAPGRMAPTKERLDAGRVHVSRSKTGWYTRNSWSSRMACEVDLELDPAQHSDCMLGSNTIEQLFPAALARYRAMSASRSSSWPMRRDRGDADAGAHRKAVPSRAVQDGTARGARRAARSATISGRSPQRPSASTTNSSPPSRPTCRCPARPPPDGSATARSSSSPASRGRACR